MRKKLFAGITLCLLTGLSGLEAEVRLAGVFGDNMVVQRESPVKVWGWADRNEPVTVVFNGQQRQTRAGRDGAWNVFLDPMPAGGPYVMEVKGKSNTLNVENMLVGEVWLCSGQSNMEWPVSYAANAEQETVSADYPEIRAMNVQRRGHIVPQTDLPGRWEVCSPATVGDFSAVAYFYARELYKELGVPVGIINASWGGTDIETWISPASYKALPAEVQIPYDPQIREGLTRYFEAFPGELDRYSERMAGDAGMAEKWYGKDTDDKGWERMQIPQEWETTPLAEVDGLVWFRYAFTLPASAEGLTGMLYLGRIDDSDITWINGVEMGRTSGHAQSRVYPVPAGVLKAGRNVIAVRVEDMAGPGGFTGPSEDLFLEITGSAPVKIPLAGSWNYFPSVVGADYRQMQVGPDSFHSLLYNGMVHPLTGFRIRGVIWYQGENNAIKGRASAYHTLFTTLIGDWRGRWGYEFPFYWVQLANFMAKEEEPADSQWGELREAQTQTLSLPQTGQAVIIDIGDALDIHPRNKQDVGKRLALNALHGTYGKQGVIFSGPTYLSMEKQGHRIVLSFDLHGSRWDVRNKYGYIEGFAIAGADGRFHWARAELQGDGIEVWSDRVTDPVAVRYGWGNNPDINLFNREGLPAVPFRTDH